MVSVAVFVVVVVSAVAAALSALLLSPQEVNNAPAIIVESNGILIVVFVLGVQRKEKAFHGKYPMEYFKDQAIAGEVFSVNRPLDRAVWRRSGEGRYRSSA